MEIQDIEGLMKLMKTHGFSELELTTENSSIRLSQPGAMHQGMLYPQMHQIPGFAVHPQPQQHAAPVASSSSSDKPPHSPEQARWKEIRSPFVGTFYNAPAPGADPFVAEGGKIRKGNTLCIVEAMKLMNEIEAEYEGVIREICVKNEEPVEYDQVLFRIET